jgi:membrane protein DedA with SNARE-associated domain
MDFFETWTKTLLEFLGENVGRYGYIVIGVITFLETSAFLGLVAPGEAVVVVGGILASRGPLELPTVAGVAIVGAFLGDNVGYWIGRRFGTGFLLRYGKYAFFSPATQERVRRFYEKHGGKTVFLGRFASVVRSFGPVMAGSSRMPYPAFALWSATGCFVWGWTFALIGYFFGESWELIDKYLSRAGLVGFLLGASALALYLYLARRKRHPAVGHVTGKRNA